MVPTEPTKGESAIVKCSGVEDHDWRYLLYEDKTGRTYPVRAECFDCGISPIEALEKRVEFKVPATEVREMADGELSVIHHPEHTPGCKDGECRTCEGPLMAEQERLAAIGLPYRLFGKTMEEIYSLIAEDRARNGREAEQERLAAIAQEVWDSIPASYDDNDPMVKRHARALNALGAALGDETL